MLWNITVVLVVLWALGLINSVGGFFIHILFAIASVLIVIQILQGRREAAQKSMLRYKRSL